MTANISQESDSQAGHGHHGYPDQFHEEVARACRFAASSGDVGAVHVFAGRRPTAEEITFFRRYAESHGLLMAIHNDGRVAVRRPRAVAPAPDQQARPSVRPALALERLAALRLNWPQRQLQGWDAGFSGLKDGIR